MKKTCKLNFALTGTELQQPQNSTQICQIEFSCCSYNFCYCYHNNNTLITSDDQKPSSALEHIPPNNYIIMFLLIGNVSTLGGCHGVTKFLTKLQKLYELWILLSCLILCCKITVIGNISVLNQTLHCFHKSLRFHIWSEFLENCLV